MSLIELLVALVILGVLTSFAAFYYSNMRTDAANTKVKADLMEIKKAVGSFMADEYNVIKTTDASGVSFISGLRPAKLSELVEKTFRAMAVLDSSDKIVKTYPINADINEIFSRDYSDKPSFKTAEVDIKRYFLEKIPLCPWGEAYYADLYYVCARNPDTGKIAREPYLNPGYDKFYEGNIAPTFYRTETSGTAQIHGTPGYVVLSAKDATNKSSSDAMLLTSDDPVTTLPLPDKKVTFEFMFKYTQEILDEPVKNTYENRLLETASGENYVPCASGLVYFFKDPPAVGGEADIMGKIGFGLKFSEVDWELYDSPSGTPARKIAGGGWEKSAMHTVKFIFKTASSIDCFIDGELRATAEFSTAVPSSKLYFVISPDFFNSMKIPPPPYSQLPVFADCTMNLYHILINKVDFSEHYKVKIPSK